MALFAAVPAQARNATLTPPGNSSVTQYIEPLPTVQGNRPSTSVGGGSGSTHTGAPLGSGSGGPGSGSGISPAVSQEMLAQGATGGAALTFARATTPSSGSTANGRSGASGRGGVGGALNAGGARSKLPTSSGLSPTAAIMKALTGSSSSGGLGVLLPIVFIAAFAGAAGLAVLRRRRDS